MRRREIQYASFGTWGRLVFSKSLERIAKTTASKQRIPHHFTDFYAGSHRCTAAAANLVYFPLQTAHALLFMFRHTLDHLFDSFATFGFEGLRI